MRMDEFITISMTSTILLLALLGSVSSDRLRFHLENLVDRNVSACDNFYRHACSQHVDPEEFFINRVSKIFDDVIAKITPGTDMNSPIAYDLLNAERIGFNLEDNNYGGLARERCKNDLDCYRHDQQFFAHQLWRFDIPFNFTSFESDQTNDEQINNLIGGTTLMVDELITYMSPRFINYKKLEAFRFHSHLQARIHIIEFMKSNDTYTDFHEIRDIMENMKSRMVDNIQKSPWLNRDDVSRRILDIIKDRVEHIQLYHDFDELDKNITTLQRLNHDLNQLYFSWNRKTGVLGLDAMYGLLQAYNRLKFSDSTPEIVDYIQRIVDNFGFNAFFSDEMKAVTMLAPLMYRPALCSEILKEPIITYYVLGHELYHSLFLPSNPTLIHLYGHRSKCLADHYRDSCSKFGKGSCMSGFKTIYEDGPDIESFRLVYRMLQDEYAAEEMAQPIDEMGTTLEQAYFYYAASTWCEEEVDRSTDLANDDPHSAFNIRVNSAFSLMPEFTKAFGCKAEDPMYIDEENSCYVFGPNS